MSTQPTVPPVAREPVVIVMGLVSALLLWLIPHIPGLPDNAETIMQAAVPAVMGVVASLKAASISKPTVWVGGIIAGIFTMVIGFGVDVSQTDQTAIQEAVLLIVTYLTRQNTFPEVPAPNTT